MTFIVDIKTQHEENKQAQVPEQNTYTQPEGEAKSRERRMKLTGLFMSVALAALAGTLTAIKMQVVDIESIGLVPASVEAVLLLFLWLTARYELHDWRCFAPHATEIEYQSTVTKAEESFKRIFKCLTLMLYYPLLALGASCLIKYCTITVPHLEASLICFGFASLLKWLIPKLKDKYAPYFDLTKTLVLLTAMTMMCAACM